MSVALTLSARAIAKAREADVTPRGEWANPVIGGRATNLDTSGTWRDSNEYLIVGCLDAPPVTAFTSGRLRTGQVTNWRSSDGTFETSNGDVVTRLKINDDTLARWSAWFDEGQDAALRLPRTTSDRQACEAVRAFQRSELEQQRSGHLTQVSMYSVVGCALAFLATQPWFGI